MASFDGIKILVRTIYAVAEPVIDDASDQLEDDLAGEAVALARGSDAKWDNEAMLKVAQFLNGATAKIIEKLQAPDAPGAPAS